MEITREEEESKGRFVGKEGDVELGEMTYSIANDGALLIIDHTGVNEGHEGKGIAKALYNHMVSAIRSGNQKIIPLCPYVKSMMERNKDHWDILRNNSL